MSYEKMKEWGFERKKRQLEMAGRAWTPEEDKLVCSRLTFVM
jgi:solute carrier family 25 (mitochondrial folate transporter), member 32